MSYDDKFLDLFLKGLMINFFVGCGGVVFFWDKFVVVLLFIIMLGVGFDKLFVFSFIVIKLFGLFFLLFSCWMMCFLNGFSLDWGFGFLEVESMVDLLVLLMFSFFFCDIKVLNKVVICVIFICFLVYFCLLCIYLLFFLWFFLYF